MGETLTLVKILKKKTHEIERTGDKKKPKRGRRVGS